MIINLIFPLKAQLKFHSQILVSELQFAYRQFALNLDSSNHLILPHHLVFILEVHKQYHQEIQFRPYLSVNLYFLKVAN